MPEEPLRLYRLRGGGIRYRAFGDEVVAFNPATWNTHLLDRAGVLVLEALEHEPRTRDDVVALLARAAGDDDAGAEAFTDALLAELAAADLVESYVVAAPG
ncbi:MAG: HPr-rel-A system PqqD family peptide chaperone [Burkholderiales bacterium]|nr:HPr-rel-A system PqqD family peptide chaperone [Burkholderiales bacterium]